MKILWLTNVPLPEACILMGNEPGPYGGWLEGAAKYLSQREEIELNIIFQLNGARGVEKLQGERIGYYPVPPVRNSDHAAIEFNNDFAKLLDETAPDVVHVFGTEYAQTLSMINTCNCMGLKTVISIQGLISVCAQHYMAGLPVRIQRRYTFRDYVRRDNLLHQQRKFAERGVLETRAIGKTNHIIGRTEWDRACCGQINPKAKYHFCNETLRASFYEAIWDAERCEPHSIFVSQGAYPIKGLHYMLEAMPLILKRYSDAKLYIAGDDFSNKNSLKNRLRQSSYGKYISELIDRYRLNNHVVFTGTLDERQICKRYLKSNLFVCSSSIENSSNSLGEAMILGVPSVASYVGGIPDILRNKTDGLLYQADAPYMLAHYVCEIFASRDLAEKLSKNAREHALRTHDRLNNAQRLVEIYQEIVSE